MDITKDSIFNGKLKFFQPKNGYRVSIDPIILSNLVFPKPNESVLDVGSGVGIISLILKFKNPLIKCTAIDIDSFMCKLCRKNMELNNFDIKVIEEDLRGCILKNESFDYVITNPPFYKKNASRISHSKILSNFETMELENWISLCLKRLKPYGTFCVIHHASRVDEILASIYKKIGHIEIIPIFSKPNEIAKRIIVRGQKGKRSETKILSGIIIHNPDGSYTDVAKKLLNFPVVYDFL